MMTENIGLSFIFKILIIFTNYRTKMDLDVEALEELMNVSQS